VVCTDVEPAALLPALARLLNDAIGDGSGQVTGAMPRAPGARGERSAGSFGTAIVWQTGSGRHLEQLAARAFSGGLVLAGGVLSDASGREVECPGERNLYARIGLRGSRPRFARGTAR